MQMPSQPPVHLDLQQSDPADFVAASELIRPQTQDYLFRLIEWLAYYIHQAAPLSKSGKSNSQEGQTWTYATECGISLEIQDLKESRTLRVQTTGLTSASHRAVIEHATACTDLGLIGGIWWYAVADSKRSLDQTECLQFMRSLDHACRVTGRVALGKQALLEFAAGSEEPGLAHFSPVSAKLFFLAPGIHPGPFSTRLAMGLAPNLTACASYCLGTPLDLFPSSLRRADPTQLAQIEQAVRAAPIPQLAFGGIPIWATLEGLHFTGAAEAANRAIRAIASYETAMRQRTLAATVVHLVSAIEALALPNLPSVAKHRTVKRFKDFLCECVPDVLDATLQHGNFSTAFPNVRTAKQLTDEIYDSRSRAVHSGQFGEYYEFHALDEGVRVALIAEIARAAIVSFVQCPFSSLVGHPSIDPVLHLHLKASAFAALKEKADRSSSSVEQYVLSRLFFHDPSSGQETEERPQGQ